MLVVAIVIAIIIAVAIENRNRSRIGLSSSIVWVSGALGTFMTLVAAAEDTLPVIKVTNRSHKTKLSLSGASRALHGQRP